MKGAKERPLGPQEAMFTELVRQSSGGVQLVTLAELATPLSIDDVRSRLKVVHQRHPLLHARVEDRDQLWWVCDVPFETISISTRPMGADFDLERLYASEAEIPIDVMTMSWRATLLTDPSGKVAWIAMTASHAAVDGRSMLVILNDFDRASDNGDEVDLAPLALNPSAETGLAAAGLAGEQRVEPALPKEAMCRVEHPADSTRRRPQALHRIYAQEDFDRLHTRLHRDDIHLAGAFCAATVRASEALAGQAPVMRLVAPTDLRADGKPAISGDAVGLYISSIGLELGPDETNRSLIEIARMLDGQLRDNRPSALRMNPSIPPGEIREEAERFARSNDLFVVGTGLSDVGDLNRLSGRQVGINRILMMPSQNHGVHPMLVTVVSTSQDTCLTFGFAEPLTSRAHAHAFADRFVEALDELAGGS
ncbi:MAG: hypothetical protein NXI27_14570 [Alphaproteobacteria bacterium]|nr:hypothetical protein [Alphaproteobacteria bacterium]